MGEAATVLVHGAWHGAWCWERVVPLLEEAGVPVRTLDLPLTSLAVDAAEVTALLDTLDAPVVLCGHSYGGAVITRAGEHATVGHLVYLCAFAPEAGESCFAMATGAGVPATPLVDAVRLDEEGTAVTLDDDGAVAGLYQDCDPAVARNAVSRLRPTAMACLTDEADAVAWQHRPVTYVVCAEDQGIHPELQRSMAHRTGGTVVEWPVGHSPFLNRPELVAELLADLSQSFALQASS